MKLGACLFLQSAWRLAWWYLALSIITITRRPLRELACRRRLRDTWKTFHPLSGKPIFHRADEQRRNSPRSYGWGDATIQGPFPPEEPTSGTAIHVAENGLHRSTIDQWSDRLQTYGVFLYASWSSGLARAISGRGLRRRKPKDLNMYWHWRTPIVTPYRLLMKVVVSWFFWATDFILQSKNDSWCIGYG